VTHPWSQLALSVRDVEAVLGHHEHLLTCGSPLYDPAAHHRARADLANWLRELSALAGARLAELSPTLPEGDAR